eukprot:976895_1
MATALKEWNDNPVCVVTCDGRLIQGKLIGYDQLQNLILSQAQERVYQLPPPPPPPDNKNKDDDESEEEEEEPVLEIVPLGLYIIRGDNVAIVSDIQDEIWEKQTSNQYQDFTNDSEG